jgi:hypothetical protein
MSYAAFGNPSWFDCCRVVKLAMHNESITSKLEGQLVSRRPLPSDWKGKDH